MEESSSLPGELKNAAHSAAVYEIQECKVN